MSIQRLAKRLCPVCGEMKEYPARVAACSLGCGTILREWKRQAALPKPTKEQLTAEQEHQLRRDNKHLRKQLDESLERALNLGRFNDFIRGAIARPVPDAPAWLYKTKQGVKNAIPTVFLSDTHYDERVFPEQVEGLNAFDRQIAKVRTKNFFHNSVSVAKDYLRGLNYGGIVLAMGGDIFSGDIHEELAKTNVATMQESLLYWLDPLISGIKLLADEFGRVTIPAVVGNHPRGTRKPSHKMRVPNNFDWLFVELLRKFLADDKRIEFLIAKSADIDYKVYGTRYRLSHGDQFRGGSGIAGLLSPLMIGDARKRKRSQVVGRDYDWLVLAHWHQRIRFKRIIVNGALKGYDEYAYHGNFEFETPQQSFWLTDPKHGYTIDAPIHVLDKAEEWLKDNPLRIAA